MWYIHTPQPVGESAAVVTRSLGTRDSESVFGTFFKSNSSSNKRAVCMKEMKRRAGCLYKRCALEMMPALERGWQAANRKNAYARSDPLHAANSSQKWNMPSDTDRDFNNTTRRGLHKSHTVSTRDYRWSARSHQRKDAHANIVPLPPGAATMLE